MTKFDGKIIYDGKHCAFVSSQNFTIPQMRAEEIELRFAIISHPDMNRNAVRRFMNSRKGKYDFGPVSTSFNSATEEYEYTFVYWNREEETRIVARNKIDYVCMMIDTTVAGEDEINYLASKVPYSTNVLASLFRAVRSGRYTRIFTYHQHVYLVLANRIDDPFRWAHSQSKNVDAKLELALYHAVLEEGLIPISTNEYGLHIRAKASDFDRFVYLRMKHSLQRFG